MAKLIYIITLTLLAGINGEIPTSMLDCIRSHLSGLSEYLALYPPHSLLNIDEFKTLLSWSVLSPNIQSI